MYGDGVCERLFALKAQSKDGMFTSPNKICMHGQTRASGRVIPNPGLSL